MRATGFASLLSLVGVVASAAVPQQPLMPGGISSNRTSTPLGDTNFGFILPSLREVAQCARLELRWENGTGEFLDRAGPFAPRDPSPRDPSPRDPSPRDPSPPLVLTKLPTAYQLRIGWCVPLLTILSRAL